MATRVVEGKKPYTGGKAISIDENKVISLNLRDENNLIIYDAGDDEIYVDLQLDDEITPTSAFPIGVNVGRVIVDNGWDKPGTIISAETTSGDNIKIFYADEGTLWIDNGTGTFKQIYFKADVDALLLALRNYIDGELAKKQNGVTSDTAPTNPSEGDLWYDTVNDQLQVYDGTQWTSIGGGTTYTAGDGIDITGSTISNTGVLSSNNTYDNLIHMSQADYDALAVKDPETLYSTPDELDDSNLNTKAFTITGTTGQTNLDTAQEAYDWYSEGNTPLLVYNNHTYILDNATSTKLTFKGRLSQENQNSSSFIKQDVLEINVSSDTVTSITTDTFVVGGSYLRLGQNYNTPYIPTNDGDPTSKKYVDEHGPNIPVYYYLGDFNNDITFNMIEAGVYRLYVRAYHGTTVDKTLTLAVDGTTVGTLTSNLIENLNASINFTASAGSTAVLSVSSKTNFTIQEVYIEKVNIQSGYLTATVN